MIKSGSSKRVGIVTLGCSKNTVDSEVLAGRLKTGGINVAEFDNSKSFSTVVINTCGFVQDAKQESIDTILEFADLKSSGKIKNLFVIGCMAERYKEELIPELSEVDGFFGFGDYDHLYKMLEVSHSTSEDISRELTTPSHYAYLKIAEGCNRRCSFCAIPLIRGKHISRSPEDIYKEAEKLASLGVKELILISQDLAYYGKDLAGKQLLPVLVDRLAGIKGIEWIRLHYLYPAQFPLSLLDVMAKHPKVCRYFDIPFQHISDPLLKSMKRGITRKQSLDLIARIRKQFPEAAMRTTLITGYPGETKKDFRELCDFVKEVRFDRLGVFSYSHEEGTASYQLRNSVTVRMKQERMEEIMQLQQELSWQKNSEKVGSTVKVVIDSREGDFYIGRTEFDSPEVDNEVLIPVSYKTLSLGGFYHVMINGADFFDLYAEPISD